MWVFILLHSDMFCMVLMECLGVVLWFESSWLLAACAATTGYVGILMAAVGCCCCVIFLVSVPCSDDWAVLGFVFGNICCICGMYLYDGWVIFIIAAATWWGVMLCHGKVQLHCVVYIELSTVLVQWTKCYSMWLVIAFFCICLFCDGPGCFWINWYSCKQLEVLPLAAMAAMAIMVIVGLST